MVKVLMVVLAAIMAMTACTGAANGINAGLGQEFNLAIGQKIIVGNEKIEIKVIDIYNDSRSPTGATTVWRGEVKIIIEITRNGETQRVTLTEPGLSTERIKTIVGEYELQFKVTPYPKVNEQIAKKDYRLNLVVVKKPVLSGGILATFSVVGESYNIFVTNKKTIDQIFALQKGESQASIPVGRVVRGAVSYNQPWNWHIDPEEVNMAEMTIELSDGLPSHVESDIDYWVNTVRYYTPWSAKLVAIQDYR